MSPRKAMGWGLIPCLFLAGCASHPPVDKGRSTFGWSPPPPLSPQAVYQIGVASFYGKGFHGRPTANADVFDRRAWTAAHLDLPFGTVIRVTNLENTRHCIVRVNDRGPYARGRILDLAQGAAEMLGMVEGGTARVRIQIVKWPDRPR